MQLNRVQFEIIKFNLSELDVAKAGREQDFRQYYVLDSDLRSKESRKKEL